MVFCSAFVKIPASKISKDFNGCDWDNNQWQLLVSEVEQAMLLLEKTYLLLG